MGSRWIARAVLVAAVALGCADDSVGSSNKRSSSTATTQPSTSAPTEAPFLEGWLELGEFSAETDLLTTTLDTDPEAIDLITQNPLINDGGAVFLEEAASLAYRTAQVCDTCPGNGKSAPRWRRFDVRLATGPLQTTVACEEATISVGSPGAMTLCFDKKAKSADVSRIQRLTGSFVLDFDSGSKRLKEASGAAPTGSTLVAKNMDLITKTKVRFFKGRSGWVLGGAAATRVNMANAASQSIYIQAIKLILDTHASPETSFADVLLRQNFNSIKRIGSAAIRVRVNDVTASVFVQAGPEILKLVDDGQHNDEGQGDGVFGARFPAPSRRVPQLLISAIAGHSLTSAADDYDADTLIIPLRVE